MESNACVMKGLSGLASNVYVRELWLAIGVIDVHIAQTLNGSMENAVASKDTQTTEGSV